jgi:hypothetical protein
VSVAPLNLTEANVSFEVDFGVPLGVIPKALPSPSQLQSAMKKTAKKNKNVKWADSHGRKSLTLVKMISPRKLESQQELPNAPTRAQKIIYVVLGIASVLLVITMVIVGLKFAGVF